MNSITGRTRQTLGHLPEVARSAMDADPCSRSAMDADPCVDAEWLQEIGVDPSLFGNTDTEERSKLKNKLTPEALAAMEKDAGRLSKNLLEKLHENGIYRKSQVESLAKLGKLNEVLESLGVTDAIVEWFDVSEYRTRLSQHRHELSGWLASFLMALAGDLQSMEAMCANYGLAAALVLTMTFANFGSITTEDWNNFLARIVLPQCQKHAKKACEGEPSPNYLYDHNQPLYCITALQDLVEDPNLDLAASEHACCVDTIKCIMDKAWPVELAFAVGNGGGTAILLLVVLFTSWLYISLNATRANKDRWPEAKVLTERLSQEFLFLNIMFVVGISLAYYGMYAVLCAKVTKVNLSWGVSWVFWISFMLAGVLFVKVIVEIYMINQRVDDIRGKKQPGWREYLQKSFLRGKQSAPQRSSAATTEMERTAEAPESSPAVGPAPAVDPSVAALSKQVESLTKLVTKLTTGNEAAVAREDEARDESHWRDRDVPESPRHGPTSPRSLAIGQTSSASL